ncbi:jg21567 [Pararge aegeria aegeria]|uniref:Jg21567 protein n=1 Tax=Pararge aegeria aegeria TaxID=348720 RepID=A0A8S4RQB1_9NEOP|nr:jg21567 [Pararge aegeria aegeria]
MKGECSFQIFAVQISIKDIKRFNHVGCNREDPFGAWRFNSSKRPPLAEGNAAKERESDLKTFSAIDSLILEEG